MVGGDPVAGTGAPIARSGIGIPSPMFPGCPLCAGHQEKCLLPYLIIFIPRITVQGTHEHPHFTDGTIKAWRQREFLGEQYYLDLNLDCVAPSLLLSPRMWAQARTAAIGTPPGDVATLGAAETPGTSCCVPCTVFGAPDLLLLGLCLYSSLPSHRNWTDHFTDREIEATEGQGLVQGSQLHFLVPMDTPPRPHGLFLYPPA